MFVEILRVTLCMLFSKTMTVLNPLNTDFNPSSISKFISQLKENNVSIKNIHQLMPLGKEPRFIVRIMHIYIDRQYHTFCMLNRVTTVLRKACVDINLTVLGVCG